MDYFTTMNLLDLYGLNPNKMPLAFQFPKTPPGISSAMINSSTIDPKKKFSQKNETINLKLDDFKQMFQKYAFGLFDISFSGIISPTHPLFSRQASVEFIKQERDRLMQENLELKKQLEKSLNKTNK